MLLVTTSALVPPTRVPRRLTTGRLLKLLTFSAQHTKRKRNRWLGAGVSNVRTSSWLAASRMQRPRRCLWCWPPHRPPSINGHLRYPNDIDRSLNEAAADKIRKYRADCNNPPPNAIFFMPAIASTSGRLIVNLRAFYFYKLIGKPTASLQLQEFSLRNIISSVPQPPRGVLLATQVKDWEHSR
jgi:hypothetical protein